MNLHYGLIHVGLPTMVDLTRDNLPNIKEDNMPKNFELCKEGDVAFADASEDTNEVAKPIEFFDLAGKNIVCGLHTIHGRDNKNKTVIGFKGYAFSSSAFHNQIRRIAQGTKIYSISTKNFSECFIGIPSKVEQTKIATLLRLIDERIATQNKIIEDLKKLKSAISKHLFARKDLLETTICLSNIATLKNGYAFQSGKYNALGKWKILTITNVSGERYINDEDYNCIINLPNDIQDHQVLKEGDILISLTGNVGRVSLCKDGDYLLNQRVGLLQLAKNVNQEFLYQILSSQRFENSMIACGQGAAQMNIGKGDVESYVLPYSSNVNNILLVAKILHSYDEYIINEQRKLTLLTMQKQYFLAQMFI
ncbi:restriction endonuclease subunit S [Phocaeicola vulgatus]